jgi:hypothetical protein
MTKENASSLFVVILLATLAASGCESEEERQHHLYNLHICVAETYKADKDWFDTSTFESDTNPNTRMSKEMIAEFKSPAHQQRDHDRRAADCMMHEEKTTLEYQLAKHDDYGKIKVGAAAK